MRRALRAIIRADASAEIGTGHVMRCLSLADALAAAGGRAIFVCRPHTGHLGELISRRGHGLHLLPDAPPDRSAFGHAAWLGTDWRTDANQCGEFVATMRPDWLIVDHYALDSRWESVHRPHAGKILAVDDLGDRDHDCDVLLDQNLYSDMETRYVGKVPSQCRLLLGPKYALLRDEFRQARMAVRARAGLVRRILVSMGGVDAGNTTGLVIAALGELDLRGVDVDVVVGNQHPHGEEIQSTCIRLGFSCHTQTNRMAELMAAADLSVGAGGSMTWERCCLGLPAIVVPVAMNQRESTRDLDRLGIIEMVDVPLKQLRTEVATAVDRLRASLARRHDMSAAALLLVDGQGTLRVANSMIASDGST